jgi:predicted TIM-barrel fold metal-dependent hydrolase
MNVFDCHFHIETGLDRYDINIAGKNVIFNSFGSYHQFKGQVGEQDSTSLIFDYRNNFDEVRQLMTARKIDALKIHNRVQQIAAADYPVLMEHLEEANPALPIIIDAFYFGDDLEFQPDLANIISIARRFPNNPVIVAHCGGIEILKYFYHLKSLDNIFFDLSFSLAYLKNTSVYTDFKNLIKYGNRDNIMFGTDYPFVSAKLQLDAFTEIADEMNVTEQAREKMLYSNAVSVFKKR